MKCLAGVTLTLFLGLMFASLFQMSGLMSMSHTVSGMTACPSMVDQEVLCTSHLSEHIGVWKTAFANLLPSAFSLFLVFGLVVAIVATAPHLLKKHILHYIPIRWQLVQHKTYTYTVRAYQELFSKGILHPKLF